MTNVRGRVPFEADASRLSENNKDIIAREYGLAVIGNRLTGGLTVTNAAMAEVEIGFVATNPNIPAENVISRLDNYRPRNISQEHLLRLATGLVRFRELARLSGLIVCGEAGLGKTHIAVGVAKQAMLEGQTAAYINASRAQGLSSTSAEKVARDADIVILDDMNSRYGVEADFFRALVGAMHDKGSGKLLVTSNYESPGQLVADLTAGPMVNVAQTARLRDRIGGALMGHTVEGDSYRRQKQINQAPWWDDAQLWIQ